MSTATPVETSTSCSVVARVRTLIVDDHPLFRMALRELLARQPELDVVAEAGTLAEATECLAHDSFDMAIVDLSLPDGRGVVFVDRVLNAQPDCKVLAVSGVEEPTQIAEMLHAGALGFVLKSQRIDEILGALRCVLAGGRSVPESSRDQVDTLLNSPDAWPLERLTPREREVFDLLVASYTNDGIATKLSISKRTVETHRLHLMAKLSAHCLGDLLQVAARHGLFD